MNRSFASRMSALLLALMFLSGQAGREASHACPIHDSVSIQHPHALHGAHVAQGEHAEHHGATSPASGGASHEHGADCTCIGSCNVSSPGILAPTVNTLAFTEYFSTTAPAFRPVHTVLPGRPDFQLPLSSGPPDVLRTA